jgi:hypothetical protein
MRPTTEEPIEELFKGIGLLGAEPPSRPGMWKSKSLAGLTALDDLGGADIDHRGIELFGEDRKIG